MFLDLNLLTVPSIASALGALALPLVGGDLKLTKSSLPLKMAALLVLLQLSVVPKPVTLKLVPLTAKDTSLPVLNPVAAEL